MLVADPVSILSPFLSTRTDMVPARNTHGFASVTAKRACVTLCWLTRSAVPLSFLFLPFLMLEDSWHARSWPPCHHEGGNHKLRTAGRSSGETSLRGSCIRLGLPTSPLPMFETHMSFLTKPLWAGFCYTQPNAVLPAHTPSPVLGTP